MITAEVGVRILTGPDALSVRGDDRRGAGRSRQPCCAAGCGARRYAASAFAFSWSNSAWLIAPLSKSSLALAICSEALPEEATERT